eukprot:2871364-Ditylum_brightwellii.AAC.1
MERLIAHHGNQQKEMMEEREALENSHDNTKESLKTSVEIISQLKDVLAKKESQFIKKMEELKSENKRLKDNMAQKESELQKQLVDLEEAKNKAEQMTELRYKNDQL